MWTLFILIISFVPAEAAINGEAGWKHTHSVNVGQYETLEQCELASLDTEILSYPGYPDTMHICVQGWESE